VSGDVMVSRWGVAKDRMIGEKGLKLALTIYHDSMQYLFYQILSGGAI